MQVHLVRVDLVAVGSLAADYGRLVADYERRLGKYVRFAAHEVKATPVQRGEAVVLREEAARIVDLVARIEGATRERPTLVALDPRGRARTTEQLVEDWLGVRHLVLLVGGTVGLAPELIARADARTSFGPITLPHQLARLVATEQLYRCFRIARGEPYHCSSTR